MNTTTNNNELLRLENISKQFPGTLALDNINFDVKAGEVHVLFGENGAGKSTLIQIIAGVYQQTKGKIFVNGKETSLSSVHQARELGISAVFQEFSISPNLTVEENMFLGSEIMKGPFLNKKKLHEEAEKTLNQLGFPLKTNQNMMYLSRAELQVVEIAKAFRTKPVIMILDEPTASLTERETNRLFELIETLKSEGIGIIYITHRMREIQRIGDRITILRDGKFVDTIPVAGSSEKKMVNLMTGRVIDHVFPSIKNKKGDTYLSIKNLSDGRLLDDVSMEFCAGEVVGIAGLVGSGKSAIGRVCFGIHGVNAGQIDFLGENIFDSNKHYNDMSPSSMLDRGYYYIPSDRGKEGLMLQRSARENVSLPSLKLPKFVKSCFLRRQNEKKVVTDILKNLDLSPLNIELDVEHFSGGNQQKVLIAKALAQNIKLFVFDEPTVGVDVGARILIYKFIQSLCESGAAVILISSDLPEILHLTHRTYVMHRGKLMAELSAEETTEEAVLGLFFEKNNETENS